MENSTPNEKQTPEEIKAANARDLLAAANHVRAVAHRTGSESFHAIADQLVQLPAAIFGVEPRK